MKYVLAVVALLFVFSAVLVTCVRRTPPVAPSAAEVDLAPIVARLEALEKRLGELSRASELPRVEAGERAAVEAVRADDGVAESKLAELAARVEKLERSVEPLVPNKLSAEEARVLLANRAREMEGTLRYHAELARNAANSEEQRLEGLRNLRNRTLADGTDARLQVLDEMIRLAQSSTSAETRADVWRQMSHVTDARLEGPLLDALALDPDEKVREEAAETLADFMPDAQVEAALRSASQNDVSTRVRSQALRSLAGGR